MKDRKEDRKEDRSEDRREFSGDVTLVSVAKLVAVSGEVRGAW